MIYSHFTFMEVQEQVLSHDKIQQEVYNYLWNYYPATRRCFWHTPNELTPDTFITDRIKWSKQVIPKWLSDIISQWHKNFVVKLSKRKAIGVLAGVTDLVLFWSGTLYMFDIKIGKDRLSEAQIAFIAANEAQGGKFFQIGSIEEGKSIIDQIMQQKLPLWP